MSNKVRVYELARETNLENKEVLRRLADLGIDAKSHSSSVTQGERKQFLESLGKTEEERRREEEERKRKEREELERYKQMETAAPEGKKAKKVLPPHLRKQQEEEEAAAAAAEAAKAPAEPTEPAAEPDEPETEPEPAAPAAAEVEAPAAAADEAATAATEEQSEETAEGEAEGDGSKRRMPGAPPPTLKKGQVPLRPPSPSRPKAAEPPPTVTGEGPEVRRRHEMNLPKEGSGKRHIPPPLKKAPKRPSRPSQPGKKSGGGRPGTGQSGSPYRQPVGRGKPGQPGGGPGGPPGGGGKAPSGKTRRKRREHRTPEEHELQRQPRRRDVPIEEQIDVDRVEILSGVTVAELADELGVAGAALVKKLFEMGEMATVQQSLPDDTVEILGAELGFEVYFLSEEEVEFGVEEPDAPEDLEPRPPVVTVLGHVDHGKTLLLDAIRETDVVSDEAGGITQHIGAYQVSHDGSPITFIDTPGHEAFTAMRARGAQVTDIAILVVAADDGVMPQTVEAINHAKAAEVPIVVAINKMDLETANPDKVKGQLTEYEVIPEDYGGEVPTVGVSAMTKDGLDELLEIITLQAELLELQANPTKDPRGRVIEAHLDKGRGPVATVLVQAGTLSRGDILIAGEADGRIRAMFDEDGNQLQEAPPGTPVQILGLNEVPEAGDEFRVVENDRIARDIAERRQERHRRAELAEQSRPKTLEDLTAEVEAGEKATLNVIIKADVSGSAEALEDALTKLELEEVQVEVVSKGVGAVTLSDARLAEASDAIVVAFNVRPDANARDEIESSGVDVRTYSIIYEAIEDIERAVKGLLGPEFEEQVLGEAEVREIFKVPRVGFVFGCMVTDGEVRRDASVRVIRDGVVVADDEIASLKRFQDDVREVSQGYECGIGLAKFQDVKEGDVFEVYETVEIERV
ncbi:MAG: translation initiation factor IF-2 [Nitriliruptorales bacterium]|nr:translation initiation factor IF-2 [Nitriliruptorales bacterium]